MHSIRWLEGACAAGLYHIQLDVDVSAIKTPLTSYGCPLHVSKVTKLPGKKGVSANE